MNRRDFARMSLAAVGGVFMSRHWYRQSTGLYTPIYTLPEYLTFGGGDGQVSLIIVARNPLELRSAMAVAAKRRGGTLVQVAPGFTHGWLPWATTPGPGKGWTYVQGGGGVLGVAP